MTTIPKDIPGAEVQIDHTFDLEGAISKQNGGAPIDNGAPAGGAPAAPATPAANNNAGDIVYKTAASGYDPVNGGMMTEEQLEQKLAAQNNGQKTPEQIAEEEKAAQAAAAASQQQGANNGAPASAPGSLDLPVQVFNDFKKIFGEDYKIPDGLTKENYTETLVKETFRLYDSKLPAEVKEFYAHIQKGGTAEDFKPSTIDLNKLPTDDVLTFYFEQEMLKTDENPDGMTKEEIADYVKNMDTMQKRLQAKSIREASNKQKEINDTKQKTEYEERVKKETIEANTKNGQIIDTFVEKYKNIKDIYGMPVSPEQVAEFGKEFKELMTQDETGVSPAQRIIFDNEAFFKLMFLAKKAGYTQDFLREAKNQEIQGFKNKLPGQPASFQSSAQKNTSGPDLDRLAAPAID
jgi:hypothetical protein